MCSSGALLAAGWLHVMLTIASHEATQQPTNQIDLLEVDPRRISITCKSNRGFLPQIVQVTTPK